MNLIILGAALLIVLFAGIVIFGAPYVPTKQLQIKSALDLLKLKMGEVFYDLGAGDGRVALAAAMQGAMVVGYELNPVLVLIARYRTRKYRSCVQIKWQNYWDADFSKCDAVYIFSTSAFMARLDKKLRKSQARLRLASFAFEIPDKRYSKSKNGIFLYQY